MIPLGPAPSEELLLISKQILKLTKKETVVILCHMEFVNLCFERNKRMFNLRNIDILFRKKADIIIGPPNGIVKHLKKLRFRFYFYIYVCCFIDLKHVEGIKVSENGFEIFSSNHVENLNVIGPGLKKLFEMTGLDIIAISLCPN